MRPILIGAGRGSRLEDRTTTVPKTLVEVMGRPMLDWILEALGEAGFRREDVVFVCGYKADVLRERYPEFTYVTNHGWASNNILASLMCAREYMTDGFVCSYTDIIYRGSIVRELVTSPFDRVLGCDTEWRRRYATRTQHPETDGEKLRAEGDRVLEVARTIAPADAHGEYIGVAKFTWAGAADLLASYDAGTFGPRAYLIELFQAMIERGADFRCVDTHGGYMELDTLEDLSFAETWWNP
jgi:L-glutamine-phosphate cytidylyltransferase